MKPLLAVALLVALAAPAAAQVPAVTLQLPTFDAAADAGSQRVPHGLGPTSESLAAQTAPLPGPQVLFTGDAVVVHDKASDGVLAIPNFLNAGATRVDDQYVYPRSFSATGLDLDSDVAAATRLANSGARTAAVPRQVQVDPASVPDLQLGLDLGEGSVNACAVACAVPGLAAATDLAAGAGGAASAEGAPGLASPARAEGLAALPLDLAPLRPAPAAAAAAPPAPLAVQGAGPAFPALLGASPELLAASALALGALALLPFALYSKIRRDATLVNDTRRGVFEAVASNPGLSIQEVARRAAISHSTAAYHLDRLAGAGLVVATGDGNKVRYYRNGGRFTEQERKLLPCLENTETVRVLETVLHSPWTYRAEVAGTLGVTATTVNWHLKRLFGAGVLSEVREGRSAYLFVDRPSLGAACAGLAEKTPDSPARAAAQRLAGHLGVAVAAPAGPAEVPSLAPVEFRPAPPQPAASLGPVPHPVRP